jgi:hypothetical protein
MNIAIQNKARMEFDEDTFFDVLPYQSHCAELIFYPGLSYLAIIKTNKHELKIFLCPDKTWFDEYSENIKEKLTILFEMGIKEGT